MFQENYSYNGKFQENQFLGMECSNKNYFLTWNFPAKLFSTWNVQYK
jgi:hypothetical protein